MTRQRMFAAGMIVLATVAIASPAFARMQARLITQAAHITGNGRVIANGDLFVDGLVRGRGARIIVTSYAANTTVSINGVTRHLAQRRSVQIPSSGRLFVVNSTNARIELRGSQIDVTVAGTGHARTQGSGTITGFNSSPRRWDKNDVEFDGGMGADSGSQQSDNGVSTTGHPKLSSN